jgi:sulfonate transport system substrate-binding protein
MNGKRKLLPLLAIAIALPLLAASGASGRNEQFQTVRLGLVVEKSFEIAVPAKVAAIKRFFHKRQIAIKVIAFQGGADLVRAMVGGSVDIGSATGLDAASTNARGVELKCFAGFMSRSPMVIFASSKGKVRSLNDLRGATVGVTRFGSLTDFIIRNVARRQRLDPRRDLKVVALGGAPEQVAAIERGDTDAFVWSTELPVQLQQEGKGRIIARFANLFPQDQYGCLNAMSDYLEKNKATVRNFLRGYFDGVCFMRANKRYVVAYAARELALDRAVISRTYDLLIKQFAVDGSINRPGLQRIADQLPDLGIAPNAPSVSDMINTEFLPVPSSCAKRR